MKHLRNLAVLAAIAMMVLGCKKDKNTETPIAVTDEQIEALYEKIKPSADSILLSAAPIAGFKAAADRYRAMDGVKNVEVTNSGMIVEFDNGFISIWNKPFYFDDVIDFDVEESRKIGKRTTDSSADSDKKLGIIVQFSNTDWWNKKENGKSSWEEGYNSLADAYRNKGWSVDMILRPQATVNFFLNNLNQYDALCILTHGDIYNGIVYIASGEPLDDKTANQLDEMKSTAVFNCLEEINGKTTVVPYRSVLSTTLQARYKDHSFNNTIVYSCACHGLETSTLANAFINNGASVYMGWNESNCKGAGIGYSVFGLLLDEGYTIQETKDKIISIGKSPDVWEAGGNHSAEWHPDASFYFLPVSAGAYTLPTVPPPGAPVPDFSASATTIAVGSSITFSDLSTGSPTTYLWTFPGGSPGISPLQNPTVKYDTAGIYSVTLTAINGNGSNSKTKTAYITVTNGTPQLPTLTTTTATNITATTATTGGNITAQGGSPITARGVCWSTDILPTTANSKTTDGSGTGSFTATITGLAPNTLYHVRAYATNAAGTAYGNSMGFTTSNNTAQLPTLTTTEATNITATTATTGGNITNDHGSPITARGVCWDTKFFPTIDNPQQRTINGSGTGSFTATPNLTPNTTYYVRAYATNAAGTAYGNQITVITPNTTNPGSEVEASGTTGTLTWTLTKDGTLTISGSGEMPSPPYNTPWIAYKESIKSIVINNGVTKIGGYAFDGYVSLTNITIPNSVTSIGNYVFNGCSSLTYVTVPNSVTSIGDYAFFDCSSLTNVTIPNSVTSIGHSAFWGCSSLTSVTIPNSITSIGSSTFWYCSSLTNITIPNSVTSIGQSAFSGCSSLTNVTIPNSVTSIERSIFGACSSLTSITIPNSVTSIGIYAFDKCFNLTNVTILATTPPVLNSQNFTTNTNDVLHVPIGSLAAYQASSWATVFTTIVEQ